MLLFQVPADTGSADYRVFLANYARAIANFPSSSISRRIDTRYGLARVRPKKWIGVPAKSLLRELVPPVSS